MSRRIGSLRALRNDSSGLALIEFALSLPIILSMGLGGVELAHLALATERVSQIAMLVADNAGRVRDTIDEINVNEVMTGAKFVGQSIEFAENGRVILSSVQNNPANNGQWIRWQRCAGAKTVASSYGVEGDGKTDTTLAAGVGPTGNKIAASTGTMVMFVEVVYTYQPVVPMDIFGTRVLRSTAAFNVRQRNPQPSLSSGGIMLSPMPADLLNSKSLGNSAISSCSTYSS